MYCLLLRTRLKKLYSISIVGAIARNTRYTVAVRIVNTQYGATHDMKPGMRKFPARSSGAPAGIRIATLVLLAAFVIVSCATTPETSLVSAEIGYQVQSRRVESSGGSYSVHRLAVYRDETDTVEVGIITYDSGAPNDYVVSIVYTGDEWRFMEGDVLIRVDRQLWNLRDRSPHREGGYKENVTERLVVTLTDDQFRELTRSTGAALEYHPGKIVYISRAGSRAMRRFYNEFAGT